MSLQNIEAGSSGSEEELVAVQPQEQGETDDQLEPLQAVQLPLPTIAGDRNAMSERASPSINGERSSENDMWEDNNPEPESSDINTESDSNTESESEAEEVTDEIAYWAIVNNVP